MRITPLPFQSMSKASQSSAHVNERCAGKVVAYFFTEWLKRHATMPQAQADRAVFMWKQC